MSGAGITIVRTGGFHSLRPKWSSGESNPGLECFTETFNEHRYKAKHIISICKIKYQVFPFRPETKKPPPGRREPFRKEILKTNQRYYLIPIFNQPARLSNCNDS